MKDLHSKLRLQEERVSSVYLKENGIAFWKLLGEDGYDGGEFTNFEAGVMLKAIEFLEGKDRDPERLVEIIEDYLVELQPNARKKLPLRLERFGLAKNMHCLSHST